MAPATQPKPIMKAISAAVGRPIQRLILWKWRYCIQSGKEILRQEATTEPDHHRTQAPIHVMLRAHGPAITAPSVLAVTTTGRRKPQVWQNLAPIMNSVPQSAQASAISAVAAGRVASTAGSSTPGDRQNSCRAS